MRTLTSELLTSPRSALDRIREHPSAPAATVFGLSGWLSCLTGVFVASGRTVTWPLFCVFFLAGGAVLLIATLLKSAWLHALSQVAGGQGRMTALFDMLLHCLLPFHLFLPVALLTRGHAGVVLPVFWILSVLWMIVFGLRSIRVNYGLSAIRTLAVAFAPAALFLFMASAVLVIVLSLLAAKGLAFLFLSP